MIYVCIKVEQLHTSQFPLQNKIKMVTNFLVMFTNCIMEESVSITCQNQLINHDSPNSFTFESFINSVCFSNQIDT